MLQFFKPTLRFPLFSELIIIIARATLHGDCIILLHRWLPCGEENQWGADSWEKETREAKDQVDGPPHNRYGRSWCEGRRHQRSNLLEAENSCRGPQRLWTNAKKMMMRWVRTAYERHRIWYQSYELHCFHRYPVIKGDYNAGGFVPDRVSFRMVFDKATVFCDPKNYVHIDSHQIID